MSTDENPYRNHSEQILILRFTKEYMKLLYKRNKDVLEKEKR